MKLIININNILVRFFKSSYRILSLVLFFSFIHISSLYCIPEPVYTNGLLRSDVYVGNKFEVMDDKYKTSYWDQILQTRSVRNAVIFEIDEKGLNEYHESNYVGAFIEFLVSGTRADGSSFEELKRMELSYDKEHAGVSEMKRVYLFSDIHVFNVSILNAGFRSAVSNSWEDSNLRGIFNLRGEIAIDRVMPFECTQKVEDATYTLQNFSRAELQWRAYDFADEYDVEWTYYDENSEVVRRFREGVSFMDNELFNNNATRVVVKGNQHNITLVYPKGCLFYRIRAAHYDVNNQREVSRWSSFTDHPQPFASVISMDEHHEPNWHWQTQLVFAEEGKFTQNVKYYDATLRERQTLSLSKAQNPEESVVLAGHTLYDHYGRPTVQVMPAPLIKPELRYNHELSKNGSGVDYSRQDFIKTNNGNDCVETPVAPMKPEDSRGAANYYSLSNPDANTAENRFIPNAEGYPFSQVEYTPDMTGRVRRQGGVGADYQLNSGHETKYYYGRPSQEELDQLFGLNAGFAEHYLKNMVQDPNGQLSIAYVDAHGRTVATALAGKKPDNLGGLNTLPTADEMLNINLLSNNRQLDASLESSYTILVNTDGVHTFDYLLQPQFFQDSCMTNRCYDCAYDLSITITASDDCNFTPVTITKKNFDFNTPIDELCNSVQIAWGNTSNTGDNHRQSLKVGTYVISKKLTLNQDILEKYLDNYLKSNCVKTVEDFIRIDPTQCMDEEIIHADQICSECKNTDKATFKDLHPNMTSAEIDRAFALYQSRCRASCQSECDGLYQQLLGDVSPAGQYGIKFENNHYVSLPSGVLQPNYRHPNTLPYLNDKGELDLLSINGMTFRPEQLTFDDFIRNWKPSWGHNFVKYHPEYCYLQWCDANAHLMVFNDTLSLGTLADKPRDVLQNLPLPYNSPQAGQGDPFGVGGTVTLTPTQLLRLNYVNWQEPNPSQRRTLYQFAAQMTYCTDPATVNTCNALNLVGTCPDKDTSMYFTLMNLYLSARRAVLLDLRDNSLTAPSVATCSSNRPQLQDAGKTLRVFTHSDLNNMIANTNTNQATTNMADACQETCEGAAEAWLSQLGDCVPATGQLRDNLFAGFVYICKNGCDANHPNGSSSFVNVQYPNTAIPNEIRGMRTVEEILRHYLGSYSACAENCTAYKLQNPPPYDALHFSREITELKNDDIICTKLTEYRQCVPTALQNNDTLFVNYLNQYSNVKLDVEELRAMRTACAATSTVCDRNFNGSIVVPPILEGKCKDCASIKVLVDDFSTNICTPPGYCITTPIGFAAAAGTASPCNPPIDADNTTAYLKKLADYLNYKTGLNRDYTEYANFLMNCRQANNSTAYFPNIKAILDKYYEGRNDIIQYIDRQGCDANKSVLICPSPQTQEEIEITIPSCDELLAEDARIQALAAYDTYIEQVKQTFRARYKNICLSKAASIEKFTVNAPNRVQHFTLYYFDQAGNLVQTVAPAGVKRITNTQTLTDIATHRRKPTYQNDTEVPPTTYYPAHLYVTRYWFNGLNQSIKQETPDAGISYFWYDYLGRLVLSQNAQQYKDKKHSYTRFDNLDRTIEVGEIQSLSQTLEYYASNEETYYRQIDDYVKGNNFAIHIASAPNRTQITRTYYDEVPDFFAAVPTFEAQNLRNRVAVVTYSETGDEQSYTYASRYTYDVVGNVPTLIHDIPELETETYTVMRSGNTETYNHRFKRLDYHFDLISGKVNTLAYQEGAPDQYYYRYAYDSDNRLTTAQTSRDGYVWQTDARYNFYKHAPLSRLELGDYKVQGLDYAYTLQGWIKGVNGGIKDQDINSDTNTDDITQTSKDVFGYALYFNRNDFKGIGNQDFAPRNTEAAIDFKDLYNGNIRAIVNHIHNFDDIAYTYQYDQLNRISGMVSTALQSSSTWQTNYSSSTFKEAVSYDANGNILTYKRHNHTGQVLDELSYIYDNAGLTHKTNRLLAVNDAAASSAYFAEDVEGSNQYYYDQIGNITKINENGRSKDIAWNVYGKVRSVTMNTAQLTFGYDAQQNRFKKRVQKDGKTDINYYLRDAQGNTLAIYSKTERSEGTFFFWDEQHLYGSARLGIETTTLSMRGAVTNDPLSNEVLQAYAKYGNHWRDALNDRYNAVGRVLDQVFYDTWGNDWEYRLNRLLDRGDEDYILQQTQNETYTITVGNKQYELSNHLGNVLAVVSDKKLFIDNKWQATVLSAQDYYPFGMSMPNRKWQGSAGGSYRFSFNGKEDDTEWGAQDYGMRIYDKSIAKFLSVDPLTKEYPELTPYQFASNTPIMAIDLDGLEAEVGVTITASRVQRTVVKRVYHTWTKQLVEITRNSANGSIQYLAPAAIDIDGHPHAYGPNNIGLDALSCAGWAKGDKYKSGGKTLTRTTNNWWALLTDTGEPTGNPIIHTNGYYISTTSYNYLSANWKVRPENDPGRFVNSDVVPYIAIPRDIAKELNTKPGDIAYIYNTETGLGTFAIFADTKGGGDTPTDPKVQAQYPQILENVIGELSTAAARAIGLNDNCRSGGTRKSVIKYTIYPGSRVPLRSDADALQHIQINGDRAAQGLPSIPIKG